MSDIKMVSRNTNGGKPLEQLWQSVRSNPNDFISWTLLLQYSENTKDLNSIRESFNEFLSKYPNCYVYWKKLAEYELKLSNESNAFKVLERAVNAFPISIDIWLYFIQLSLQFSSNEKEILHIFERAVKHCGQDFNSSELWSLYLKWLSEKRLSSVIVLYDRLFKVSLKTLGQHFLNFTQFVADNEINDILSPNEYNIRVNQFIKNYSNDFEDNKIQTLNNIINCEQTNSHLEKNEHKIQFIRKIVIEDRKHVFENTLKEVEERSRFEDSIKRPYFHVNPLDIQQLNNWNQYLNWEITRNSPSKVIFLFERCLVPCALYEHMWIRYSNYLIENRYKMIESGEEFFENFDSNAIRDVFRRATEIHTKKSFKIHNLWSLFEEREGNFDKSLHILETFEKQNPYLIETTISKINLFHRKRDFLSVENQFEASIEKLSRCPKLCSHLSVKYSRFLYKIRRNTEKAIQVLNSALKNDPKNYSLYLRLIDIEYQKPELNVTQIEHLFDKMIVCIESHSMKISMIQRKLEFMQDFGVEGHKIQSTIYEIQNLMHGFNEEKESFPSKSIKRQKTD